jgi:mRNA-degrading endonuclease RelE of RelBE toxin-antitoxin system
MKYDVVTLASFRREAKKLIKKYPSLKGELVELGTQLSTSPQLGSSLGYNCYKVRIAIASKGKGKSGGARVITHLHVKGSTVYLLSIYDKSEKDSISDQYILELIKEISQ